MKMALKHVVQLAGICILLLLFASPGFALIVFMEPDISIKAIAATIVIFIGISVFPMVILKMDSRKKNKAQPVDGSDVNR
jgi:membrane protein implicated in regulation of membrane protease activity